MPFRTLKLTPKGEEQGKSAQSSPGPQSLIAPMPIRHVQDRPLGVCTADVKVDVREMTLSYALHGNCGPVIDDLNALPIMTRRSAANHMRTDDPELRKKLAEVKRRKTPI
ncbi:MAG: hypothetical protein ABSB29_07025 [Nitrososphaerales archaeon]